MSVFNRNIGTISLAVVVLAINLTSLPAVAQNWLTPGPFGRPVLVKGEMSDDWEIPIKLYEDADAEIYTSDITSELWKLNSAPSFFTRGTYLLTLYFHFKSSHWCLNEMFPNASKNDPKRLEFCEWYTYRVEKMVVDTRSDSISGILRVYLGRGTQVADDSVDQRKFESPIAKLDRRTQVAVRKAEGIVAHEMTEQYRQYR
jgi:hypothetical protein